MTIDTEEDLYELENTCNTLIFFMEEIRKDILLTFLACKAIMTEASVMFREQVLFDGFERKLKDATVACQRFEPAQFF